MSRLRAPRFSRREQAIVQRFEARGVAFAAFAVEIAADGGIVDLEDGRGAAEDIARRLHYTATTRMQQHSRLRKRRA